MTTELDRITEWMSRLRRIAEPSLNAADLDGIRESAEAAQRRIAELVSQHPSSDGFEDAVVELGLDIDHMQWHLAELKQRLGWDDDSA